MSLALFVLCRSLSSLPFVCPLHVAALPLALCTAPTPPPQFASSAAMKTRSTVSLSADDAAREAGGSGSLWPPFTAALVAFAVVYWFVLLSLDVAAGVAVSTCHQYPSAEDTSLCPSRVQWKRSIVVLRGGVREVTFLLPPPLYSQSVLFSVLSSLGCICVCVSCGRLLICLCLYAL